MRMRHLPHAITEDAAREWLKRMRQVIFETIQDEALAQGLYDCFPKVAAHMVNR